MNKAQFFNFMKSKNRVPDDNDYFAYQFGLTRGGNRLTTKEKIALFTFSGILTCLAH